MEFTLRLALAWLEHRRCRWPDTANPHLLINKQTALETGPITSDSAAAALRGQAATLEEFRVLHDQTAVKTEGTRTSSSSTRRSRPRSMRDTGAWPSGFPTQVQAPPKKPGKDASPEETAAWEEARRRQSSQRIRVEHANAEHRQRRPLQRYIGRREYYDQTHLAIAGLVSDRTAER